MGDVGGEGQRAGQWREGSEKERKEHMEHRRAHEALRSTYRKPHRHPTFSHVHSVP